MRILSDSEGQGQAHPNQRRVDRRPCSTPWRMEPTWYRRTARDDTATGSAEPGGCHFCNGRRRWPYLALPVAVYRDRGLGRSNFFRPMPGSRALDITELAHLVQ